MAAVETPKRERSPAQIAHAEKLVANAKARAEAKRQARLAPKEAPTVVVFAPEPNYTESVDAIDVPAPDDSDAMDAIFAKLGAALQETGTKRAERNKQISELEAVFARMDPKDYPDLADNPVIQQFLEVLGETTAARHPNDPPGTVYNPNSMSATKKRWQWRDVAGYFPDPTCRQKGRECPNCGGEGKCIETRELMPNETLMVTWNGLTHPIVAGQQQWVPLPHYLEYLNHLRATKAAAEHAEMLFGDRKVVTADPTIVGQPTGFVRGHGKGTYMAGQGVSGLLTADGGES